MGSAGRHQLRRKYRASQSALSPLGGEGGWAESRESQFPGTIGSGDPATDQDCERSLPSKRRGVIRTSRGSDRGADWTVLRRLPRRAVASRPTAAPISGHGGCAWEPSWRRRQQASLLSTVGESDSIGWKARPTPASSRAPRLPQGGSFSSTARGPAVRRPSGDVTPPLRR